MRQEIGLTLSMPLLSFPKKGLTSIHESNFPAATDVGVVKIGVPYFYSTPSKFLMNSTTAGVPLDSGRIRRPSVMKLAPVESISCFDFFVSPLWLQTML